MKSAYELAMERLEKQSPSTKLTEEQKEAIAEIDSLYRAKIAERELLLKEQLGKAHAGQRFDEVALIEDQLARDTRRLSQECEEKKEKVRQGR